MILRLWAIGLTIVISVLFFFAVEPWLNQRLDFEPTLPRSTDRFAMWLLRLGGAWMILLFLWPGPYAFAQSELRDRLSQTQVRTEINEERIHALEELNIDRRLSILEASALEVAEIKRWQVGIFGAVFAILATHVLQLRRTSKQRRENY